MSRQSCGTKSADWREWCHNKLEGRTTDPEALELDEAARRFSRGLRLARRGELETGQAQIASAFLLDTRAIIYCDVLPSPAAGDAVLDLTLIEQLIKSDPKSLGTLVLHIILARTRGSDDRFKQYFIGVAMKGIEEVLKFFELHPEHEESTEEEVGLDWCLIRRKLLHNRFFLYCAMGNCKLGIRDLTAALKIDPTDTLARYSRANLYADLNLKDRKMIHAELKRVVSEVHKDNRCNEVSYARLTITALEDPGLGTLDDAYRYHEKCLEATARREELYGLHEEGRDPQPLILAKQKIAALRNNPDAERQRRELDRVMQAGRLPDGLVHGGSEPNKTLRHVCLCCGQSAIDKGLSKLLKCGHCKQVSYCSKECQSKDWKNHKAFCKLASGEQIWGLRVASEGSMFQ